jgi:hypothetical protein
MSQIQHRLLTNWPQFLLESHPCVQYNFRLLLRPFEYHHLFRRQTNAFVGLGDELYLAGRRNELEGARGVPVVKFRRHFPRAKDARTLF